MSFGISSSGSKEPDTRPLHRPGMPVNLNESCSSSGKRA